VGVTASNPVAVSLHSSLSLGSDDQVHLIATHGKRSWYKKYSGSGFGIQEVEQWVDALRMGEGKKEKLPESLIVAAAEEPVQIKIEDITEEGAAPEHNEL
jgi:protein disulfide-isomerase A6